MSATLAASAFRASGCGNLLCPNHIAMNEDRSSKPDPDLARQSGAHGRDKFVPNHISLETRTWYFVVSSLMLIYAVSGVVRNDFYIWLPLGRRSGPMSIHLYDLSAWIAAAAAFCASANLISVIVDHYDKRNNERGYRLFAKVMFIAAIALLVLSLFASGASRGR